MNSSESLVIWSSRGVGAGLPDGTACVVCDDGCRLEPWLQRRQSQHIVGVFVVVRLRSETSCRCDLLALKWLIMCVRGDGAWSLQFVFDILANSCSQDCLDGVVNGMVGEGSESGHRV